MHFRISPITLLALSLLFLTKLNAGALTWEKDRIVTEIMKGDQAEVRVTFPFKNAGDHPVTIMAVQTSCGCTTAGLSKKTYAAGESGQIAVAFDVGERIGLQQKYITVTTDEPHQPPIRLLLQVNIKEYFSLDPELLQWNVAGKPAEQTAVLSALTSQSIIAVEAKTEPAGVFETRIEVVGKGRKYNVEIKPLSTTRQSRAVVTLRIKFTSVAERTAKIYVLVNPPGVSETDD